MQNLLPCVLSYRLILTYASFVFICTCVYPTHLKGKIIIQVSHENLRTIKTMIIAKKKELIFLFM